ncbi:MAG: antitoxin [SAR324 cluster bacterium]|nr:antitoxin [SAR324 cluster bacterium]
MIKLTPSAFEPLDEEEKELIDAAENDRLETVSNPEMFETEALAAIKSTFEKKKKITINLFENDISIIKAKALQEGIPYQTYISSIIHKFASQ